jgi:hypothetical protein
MGSDDGDGDDGGRLDPIAPNPSVSIPLFLTFMYLYVPLWWECYVFDFRSPYQFCRDDDFDQMDDDDDVDVGDADETQDVEETEILEETDGSSPPFVSLDYRIEFNYGHRLYFVVICPRSSSPAFGIPNIVN